MLTEVDLSPRPPIRRRSAKKFVVTMRSSKRGIFAINGYAQKIASNQSVKDSTFEKFRAQVLEAVGADGAGFAGRSFRLVRVRISSFENGAAGLAQRG